MKYIMTYEDDNGKTVEMWNLSYCAVTVSDRSIEQVTRYIREQKTSD